MRDKYIDVVKGLAIILVVIGHSYRQIGAGVPTEYQVLDDFIYGFHMPLFFLVSGCFFQINTIIRRRFWDGFRRISYIIFPTVLWMSVLYYPHVSYLIDPSAYELLSIPQLLIHPYAQFWFMYVLVILVVLAYLTVYRVTIFPMVFLCSLILFCISGDGIFTTIIKSLLFYMIGCILYMYRKNTLGSISVVDLASMVSIAILSYLSLMGYSNKFQGLVLLPAMGVGLVFLVAVGLSRTFFSAYVAVLGEATLFIFLFHIIFRDLVYYFSGSNAVSIVLSIFVGLIFPIFLKRTLPDILFYPRFIDFFLKRM